MVQSLQRPGAATQAVGKGANAKAGDAESAENDAKGAYGASCPLYFLLSANLEGDSYSYSDA